MISVDLDPDRGEFRKVRIRNRPDRGCGLGQIHRNAAVHYADVLVDLWGNLHRENDPFSRYLDDLHAQKLH